MTSDIERPRQRTVAELLAEHGDTASSSRRRRRRSPDDEPAEPVATSGVARTVIAQRTSSPAAPVAPAPDTSRHPYFAQSDNDRREAYRAVSRAPQVPPPVRPPVHREFPTDVMPRVPRGYHAGSDADVTGPIPMVAAASAAPPATQPPARPAEVDGGPPTQFSPGVIEDDPDDDTWADDEWDDTEWDDDGSDDDFADDPPGAPDAEYDDAEYDHDSRDDLDHHADDLDDDHAHEYDDEYDDVHDDEAEDGSGRRQARAATGGPTWPAVIAQWIAGAIGGATLWVVFRYLWKSVPVVAVAAALAVTVGLVIIVRALLRNRDLRTTIFAVLVGVLLTASPAVLVLIGR